jgi:YihY family inner membrane protein
MTIVGPCGPSFDDTDARAWSVSSAPGRDAEAFGPGWRRLTDRLTHAIDRADEAQQRHRFTSVPCAVIRKYSDDQAGRLTGQISHAAFLSVFPMLLVLLTLVGIVLDGHRSLQDDVINSALRQFPVIGTDLKNNIHELSAHNSVALVVGLVWLSYGCLRLSRSAQAMMAVVWEIDRDELPSFGHWIPRAIGFLVVVGVGFVAGGALAGLAAFGRLGSASAWVGLAALLVVNVLMYWGGFAVLIRIPRGKRAVWPGAVIAGAGWTLLQFAGAQLVNHQLRHLSNLYGTFATVLGLIWWLALAAMLTVFAAEFNVVVNRHLWPRSVRRSRAGRNAGAAGAAGAGGEVEAGPGVVRLDPAPTRPGTF